MVNIFYAITICAADKNITEYNKDVVVLGSIQLHITDQFPVITRSHDHSWQCGNSTTKLINEPVKSCKYKLN